jgi:hypothetical protein
MKKTLMATVAIAAVVGFSALATAQAPDQGKGPGGSTAQEQKVTPGAGGAIKQQGAQEQRPGQSAQGAQGTQGAKPDQRMGQEQKKETTPQRGAQDDQRGVEQKGAQEDHGTQSKGAQDETSKPTKGAQDDANKSGANANDRNANQATNSRGASVQLSSNQRTKIQGIVGHNSGARVAANVNFSVSVGAVVPRDVHVVVLPEDVVEIVPQYQGFDYVIVGDNILIIDPDTMEIVDIIPA